MRTNYFTKSMSQKSDEELKSIFDAKEDYTDEAIQAVVWELENRNIIEKSEVVIAETQKETAISGKKALNKESEESPFEGLTLPNLYSKNSIQGFTIFFSTLFGAILLMRNFKEMNKPKARVQVLVFAIGYVIFTYVMLNFLPKNILVSLLFNILGYYILIEYFWNKNLPKDLEHRKKQVWKPLLISFAILILVVILQFQV